MNVVIVGNPRKNEEEIKNIATMFTNAGVNVRYPAKNELDISNDNAIIETFARIDWADAVVAIPVEDTTFEYSTTSEVAYAKHIKKPVFIYYG